MNDFKKLRPYIAALHRAGLPAIPACAPHPDGGCSSEKHVHGPASVGKVPMVEGYQNLAEKLPTLPMLERGSFRHLGVTPFNLAIVVPRGLVVVEADSPEADAELEALIGPIQTPTRAARPGRGRAWLLSLTDMPAGMEVRSRTGLGASGKIDVLAPGKPLIVPPSVHATGHVHTWEQMPSSIAVCPPGLLELIMARVPKSSPVPRDPKSPAAATAKSPPASGARKSFNTDGSPVDEMLPSREERLDRIRAYINKMPPSIEGENGSQKLYLAAAAAVRGLCLDQDDAMMVLREDFNPRCVPPWSEAELLHKVVDASHARKVPWTYLMPGIGFDQGDAAVEPGPTGGGQPSLLPWLVSEPPTAAEPDEENDTAQNSWPTSSLEWEDDYEYVSVVITRVLRDPTRFLICFSREDDPDQDPLGALAIDSPLTERATKRWTWLRHALGLPDDADLRMLGGKRLRIQYLPKRGPKGRVGRVYPPIADNQARWQCPALALMQKRLPPTDRLRLTVERALAKRNVPWVDRSIRAWWERNWHTAVAP